MLEVFKVKVIKFADTYCFTEGLSNDMASEIRVKNGIYQVEINDNSVLKSNDSIEFKHYFSRKNIDF